MPWVEEEATDEVNTLPVNTEQTPSQALSEELPNITPSSNWVEEPETVSTNWIEEDEDLQQLEAERQERIAGKSYYQDNDATYKPIDTGENKFLEGVSASFQKPALGLAQRGLAAAEAKFGPEQTVPLTGGLTIQDLRGGGVDIARKFEDEAALAKARGESSYAVGELAGDVAKGVALLPAAGPVVGGAVAGGLYNLLAPEVDELTPEEELTKAGIEGAKGAAIGAAGGKVLGAALKTKAALPVLGGLGGLMYSAAVDEGDEAEDTAIGAAIGTAALAIKKIPPEVIKYLSSKGSEAYNAVKQEGKTAVQAVENTVKNIEKSAKEYGYGVRKLKDFDEADIPITNIPNKVEVTPEDQAILGDTIVGKLKTVKDNVSLSTGINMMYDRTLSFQQLEAKALGVKGFTERMDAPLSSAIRTASYLEPSINKAPYITGFPQYRDDVTYKEAIGSKAAINLFNIISGNITKKSRLNPDAKVFGGTWMVPDDAISLDKIFKTFTRNLKVEPKKALQYMSDLRQAEDWDKIAKIEKRTDIFFKAVDEDGNVLGRFLDDRLAKEAFPEAEVKEVKGLHYIRVGVDGQTKGVYENLKLAKNGTRFDVSGDINEIRARIAEAQKQPWAKPVENMMKQYFNSALNFAAQPKVGLLTPNELKAISQSYNNYFPAFKEAYVKESTGNLKITSGSTKKGINYARGSKEPLLDPVSQIVAYTESITRAANQNIKINAIADLWEFSYKQNPKLWDDIFVTSYDDYVKQATGAKKKALDQAVIDALEEVGDLAPIMEKLAVGVNPDTKTISFFRNGNKVTLEVKDFDQIKSLEGLNIKMPNNILIKALEAPKNFTRYAITSSPPFAVKQMFMDTVVAPLTSRTGQLPVVNMVQGALLSAVPKLNRFYKLNTGQGTTWGNLGQAKSTREVNKVLDDYATSNKSVVQVWADFANAFNSSEKGAVKQGAKDVFKKTVIPPLKGVRFLWESPSNIGENAPRQLEFFRYLTKPEKTVAQAAVSAEEVTVPFKAKGASKMFQAINTYGLFFNATLQSQYRAIRYIKNNPGEATIKITAGIVIPSLVAMKVAIDELGEENYFNINEDIRNNNFIIPTSILPESVQIQMKKYEQITGDVKYIVLPGDQLFHRTFAAPVKAIVNDNYQKTGGMSLGAQLLESAMNATTPPSVIPFAVKLPLDIMLNQDFRGNEIVPGYLKDKLASGEITPAQVFTEKTPMISRVIGSTVPNTNPIEADYFLNSLAGTTVWDIMSQITEGPLREMKGMEEAVPKNAADVNPFKFFFGGQEYSTKDLDNTYKMFNLTRNMKSDLAEYSTNTKQLDADDPSLREAADKYLSDPKNQTKIAIINYWSDGIKQMQDYSIQQREILSDNKIPPADKRRLLNELRKEANNYATAFMDDFRSNKEWMEYYNNVYPRTKTTLSPVFEKLGVEGLRLTPSSSAKGTYKAVEAIKDINLPEVTLPGATESSKETGPDINYFKELNKVPEIPKEVPIKHIPKKSIDRLLSDNSISEEFDKKFGEGTSSYILYKYGRKEK